VFEAVVVFWIAVVLEEAVVLAIVFVRLDTVLEIVVVLVADDFDGVNTPLLASAIMAILLTVRSEQIDTATNITHIDASGCIFCFDEFSQLMNINC